MSLLKNKKMRGGAVAMVAGAMLFCSASAQASPAKFDIPGAFPGDFRINFLANDFKLAGESAGGHCPPQRPLISRWAPKP